MRLSTDKLRFPGAIASISITLGLLLLNLLMPLADTNAGAQPLPFRVGERLTYDIYWGFIKVGETVMEVLPNSIFQDKPVRHFRIETRTMPLIDLVYKVRSRIEAYTDLDMNHTVLYKKNHREAGVHRNVVVTFDWKNREAAYLDSGRQEQTTEIRPGTFDPLGILYFARTRNFDTVEKFERPVTDGKKCVIGRGELLKRERIAIRGRHYDTYVIEPDMLGIEGLFEENQDARFTLWLTSDHSRIPVKISIEVFIGTVVCELTLHAG